MQHISFFLITCVQAFEGKGGIRTAKTRNARVEGVKRTLSLGASIMLRVSRLPSPLNARHARCLKGRGANPDWIYLYTAYNGQRSGRGKGTFAKPFRRWNGRPQLFDYSVLETTRSLL